jgi:hypothetical protein
MMFAWNERPLAASKGRSVVNRLSVAMAIALSILPAVVHAQSLDAKLRDAPMTISVEVEGSVPGFTNDQLSAYVSQQMADAHLTAWHFAPAVSATETSPPPNRVVWHFKTLPYAGGTVRYIGPALSKARDLFGVGRPIGVDAKMFLNGQYQSTSFDQATIKGGPHDAGLSDVIKKVMNSIVANAFASEPQTGARLAALAPVRTLSRF